jgi:hypothetical protein
MNRFDARTTTRWLSMLVLAALPPLTQAASGGFSVGSLVKYSAHIVVGKVLSSELIAGSFGNQIQECGVSAKVAVLEDLTGHAAAVLTVAFRQPPVTGGTYFLALDQGRGDFAGDVIIPPRPSEEYRALESCWSAIPELRANATAGEILKAISTENGQRVISEWVSTPRNLRVPADVPVYKFVPTERYSSESLQARDRLMPEILYLGAQYAGWPQFRDLFAKEIVRQTTTAPAPIK